MGKEDCTDVCTKIGDSIPDIVKLIEEEYHITEKDI